MVAARIGAVRFPGEIASRQHEDIILALQFARERRIVDRRAQPQVEAAVGHAGAERRRDQRQHRAVLLRVQPAVGAHMLLVAPGRDRRLLHRQAHRRPMVGPVQQEPLQDLGVAGGEPRAHARRIGPLGQAREGDHAREAGTPEQVRCLQGAEGRIAFVVVELGIAFVGSDGEAMAIRQREQGLPVLQPQHAPGRIARGTDVGELHAAPIDAVQRHAVVEEDRRRPGEQRRPLVDLVEGIRADHAGAAAGGVDDGLREREQGFARAVHGQHLRGGVKRRQVVAAHEPAGDRLAQRRRAGGGGVPGQALQRTCERRLDEFGRGVLRLADRKLDRAQRGIGRHAGEQRAQPLERIGLQAPEQRIQTLAFQPRLRCSATMAVAMPPRTLKRAVRRR